MKCPLIGGSRHGQTLSVADPPLNYIQVAGVLKDFDCHPIETYRLTYWVDGSTISRIEQPVYLHGSMSEQEARPYVVGWFKTGSVTPLITSSTRP